MICIFLAQAAAPAAWAQWLTPQGVGVAIGMLTSFLTVIALIMGMLGHKDTADKLTTARDQLDAHKQQAQTMLDLLRAVVHGVEESKKELDSGAKATLVDSIQKVSEQFGVESVLSPIVTAIQDGKTDSATLMKTLTDAIAVVQSRAQAQVPPTP